MWTAIAMTIAAIISAIVVGVTNKQNVAAQEAANETNLQAVEATNAANAEQANLAYKRSQPIQQISDMTRAGISAPAAMQKIAGGGTYQMPTLQAGTTQAAQKDFSGLAGAFERLGSMPAAVQQERMQKAQLDSLLQQMKLEKEAAEREEEQHRFDMWQKLYGKDATMSIDALSNQIVQMAADKGISLDGIDSTDKLVKAFDLGNNKIWRTMPNMARTQVVEAVRSQAAENRASQSAQDTHKLTEESIKNSILGRSKTKAEIGKILADTASLKQQYDDFNAAKDAREKEYQVRASQASLRDLLTKFDIGMQELKNSVYFDKDGKPNINADANVKIKEAWRILANLIGIDYLGDILRGIFAIAK